MVNSHTYATPVAPKALPSAGCFCAPPTLLIPFTRRRGVGVAAWRAVWRNVYTELLGRPDRVRSLDLARVASLGVGDVKLAVLTADKWCHFQQSVATRLNTMLEVDSQSRDCEHVALGIACTA